MTDTLQSITPTLDLMHELEPQIKQALAAGCRVVWLEHEGADFKKPLMKAYNDPTANQWGWSDLQGQYRWALGVGKTITGYGILNGPMSRNRFILDFDRGDMLERAAEAVKDHCGFDLYSLPRLKSGRTSSAGYHLAARGVDSVASTALAKYKLAEPDTNGKDLFKVIVEIVGTAKQAVGPGSRHKSGNLYIVESGDFFEPPVIEMQMCREIFSALRSLDESPPPDFPAPATQSPPPRIASNPGGASGLDIIGEFNRRNPIDEILIAHQYKPTGKDSFRHPNNGDTEKSVHLYEGGATFFSGNDPMSGHGRPCNGDMGVWADAFEVELWLGKHKGDKPKFIRELSLAYGMSSPTIPHAEKTGLPPPPSLPPSAPTTTAPPPEAEITAPVAIINAVDLIQGNPALREVIVDGLIRRGEVANLIASPKTGKSWSALGLAMAIATGGEWFGHLCTEGRTLLIDNELHLNTLSSRIKRVAQHYQIKNDILSDRLDVVSLRGKLRDLKQLYAFFSGVKQEKYSVIIVDSLYRAFPDGMDENSNVDITKVYNILDSYAEMTGSAFVVIHHTSKGQQGAKSVTDVGAGAGAKSRAVDAHITLRPHEEENGVIVDAVVRSFPPPVSSCWRFAYPAFHAAPDLDPTLYWKDRKKTKSEEEVELSPTRLAELCLNGEPVILEQILNSAKAYGYSDRITRSNLNLAVVQGLITSTDGVKGRPKKYSKLNSQK